KWLIFLPKLPDTILSEDPGLKIFRSEEQRELWIAINSLTFKSKEVIILHFFLDLTLQETSEFLSIPIGTCKSRLHTALQQLRRKVLPGHFSFIKEENIL
ncbi:MAG TPA: sigma factor-like helix-turn-helix DNA-binding protein, partial [Pseudoneobacillus sp.]|nr:sigma factor-like helix-turn-helix DNA-binding protein [Pseudoneobacillus sp.]